MAQLKCGRCGKRFDPERALNEHAREGKGGARH
jgi:hypothetical protein